MSDMLRTQLVPEEADGERLDRYLADELEDVSRTFIQSLIRDGHVRVDDQCVQKSSFCVVTGQVLSVLIPDLKPLDLQPEAIPLEIVFEDEQMLVVNKPVGMITHPAGPFITGTLVNALLHHCQGQLSGINGVERPGIVHRLDKETSGLLMVAKTDVAHRSLQLQIQAKTALRCYRSIVQGLMPTETGSVNAPIGRHAKHREKMAVVPEGRPAVTHWQVTETLGSRFSVLHLRLETGRTHQIRVHMAHVGHPVLGDPVYGTGLEKQLKIDTHGQVLQAYQLAFTHPTSQQPMQFEIPPDERFDHVYLKLVALGQ